jgi:hypothetical protein
MAIGRGAGVLAALLVATGSLAAQQETSAEAEARSRALSERMRVTLAEHARTLSKMQRDLERASRADGTVRDSIVRVTSQRIAELATQIARVQVEADRLQITSVDAETRSQLQAQIASLRAMGNVTRALAGQQRALTFSTRTMPRGYLGVMLSGEQNTELRDGKVITVYLSPSVIETVEPGSPAARGGLESGDTILAFGKHTLPGAVPLAEVLVPGERLTIKLRRGGRERVLNVQVGTRTEYAYSLSPSYGGSAGYGFSCSGEDCTLITTAPRAPRTPRTPEAPGAARAPQAPTAAMPALPSLGGMSWSSTDFSIAGAVMTSITSELEDLTGTDEGILVLRVAPGTPAATSGLRGGDVIIRINDEECEGVRDLQIAVQRARSRGERGVALVVSRKQKEKTITLQW